MGINVNDAYDELNEHAGHDIQIDQYKNGDEVVNVAMACHTCNVILLDFDRTITKRVGPFMVVSLGRPDKECPAEAYNYQGSEIESFIKRETCDHCGKPDCCYTCDGSVADLQSIQSARLGDPEDKVAARLQANGAIDGIESLTLALAAAGFGVESPAFEEAVETVLDAVGENYG